MIFSLKYKFGVLKQKEKSSLFVHFCHLIMEAALKEWKIKVGFVQNDCRADGFLERL